MTVKEAREFIEMKIPDLNVEVREDRKGNVIAKYSERTATFEVSVNSWLMLAQFVVSAENIHREILQ